MDETNANNQFIKMSSDIGYKTRLLACEKINEKFGLNVRVVEVQDELESEVLSGGKLHDDIGTTE